ncbi:tail fiber domain-containing protein [Cupriavidus basilensis]|uniref:tail fiber domain-containing protein n=1 Tax=Cupriavidus basilensis TaxID=68895 RepID=UPI0007509FB3|nr:tail fiber domain-containing protein [Cupriavidus basilensis]
MTSVTFTPDVGGDGITIDDSDNPSTGLANGGHRTRFMIALQQFLKLTIWVKTTAQAVLGYRDAAATSAASAQAFAAAAQAAAGAPSYAGKANYVFAVNASATGVGWTDTPVLTSVTARVGVLSGASPQLRMDDTAQAGALGLFDLRNTGGSWALVRNTAAARDFSTATSEYIVSGAGRHLFGGVADDGATKYQLTGDIRVTGVLTATNVTAPSDITLKTDLEALVGVLSMLKRLRVVRHGWKGDESGRKDIGVIAQDLLMDLPELVVVGPDGKLSVNYPKLSAVLLAAIQEQDLRLTALESR